MCRGTDSSNLQSWAGFRCGVIIWATLKRSMVQHVGIKFQDPNARTLGLQWTPPGRKSSSQAEPREAQLRRTASLLKGHVNVYSGAWPEGREGSWAGPAPHPQRSAVWAIRMVFRTQPVCHTHAQHMHSYSHSCFVLQYAFLKPLKPNQK